MSTAYYDKVLQQDLNTGVSTGTRRNPGGGTLTGTQISLSTFARGQLETTSTWDPGEIANGAEAATTVTVAGAALGDHVSVSFSLDVEDLVLDAQVTAANTVSVVLANVTGGPKDLGSGTLSVLVFAVR
jgi:hypothetical protein